MNKHTLRLTGAALAAMLAAAACGGTASVSTSSAPASSPAAAASSAAAKPASAAPASASAKPAASAAGASAGAAAKPSGSAAAAAAGGPIKIGYITPLTGTQAAIAKDNQDGFNLYMDSINSTVAGRKIEVTFADNQLKPDVGLTKAKELVENAKVSMLMGFSDTPTAYAVATYVKDAHIPMLININAGGQGMMLDPKFASPYLVRITQNGAELNDTIADYIVKQGKKKAIMLTQDFAPGIENSDLFGSAYVYRGGSVLQEIHPATATTDFGPFIAQLNKDADVIYAFETGVDGLRFLEQYRTVSSGNGPLFVDLFGSIVAGPNLAELKDKALGITANSAFSEAYDDPGTQNFMKAWRAKYPGRLVSADAASGYAGAQVLEAALKKVAGKIEDQPAFLQALYGTDVDTARGPLKLDKQHDVVQDIKIYGIEKQGDSYGQKMIEAYKGISAFWDRTEEQLTKFPYGQMKGKWVGMTKDKLGDVITLPKS
jgi:branched-chain amino acid transport system substrate-binding protein